MALRMLGKDPNSPEGNSPTVYLDEELDCYLVQGYKVEDAERLGQMAIPGHETVVQIPRYMVQFFREDDRFGTGANSEMEKDGGGSDV
ncbi:hypothetical protein ACL02R_09630 [Streptomyces sp. MS19]|uniref:hypothetical protein n=1 Tax=Streptomyces sp. MS19 TaxID=3385972 RepID=UPI0039A0FE17